MTYPSKGLRMAGRPLKPLNARAVTAAVIGSAMEWYDCHGVRLRDSRYRAAVFPDPQRLFVDSLLNRDLRRRVRNAAGGRHRARALCGSRGT